MKNSQDRTIESVNNEEFRLDTDHDDLHSEDASALYYRYDGVDEYGQHYLERIEYDEDGEEVYTEEYIPIAFWNRRVPEPMTSVIKWTRYDGSPGTLPEKTVDVLMMQTSGYFIGECFYGRLQDDVEGTSETGMFWDLLRKGCIDTQIGDLWAYLPTPPEGME